MSLARFAHLLRAAGSSQGIRRVDSPAPLQQLHRCLTQALTLTAHTLPSPSLTTTQVFDSDFGPNDELMGVSQFYFTEEEIETDPETSGQAVVFKPK